MTYFGVGSFFADGFQGAPFGCLLHSTSYMDFDQVMVDCRTPMQLIVWRARRRFIVSAGLSLIPSRVSCTEYS